jgi:hypothetical protein
MGNRRRRRAIGSCVAGTGGGRGVLPTRPLALARREDDEPAPPRPLLRARDDLARCPHQRGRGAARAAAQCYLRLRRDGCPRG